MGVDDPIEVSCLDTEKAWDLFRKKVGENTLGSHPDILELARKVAVKCRGLPLALNVIGETMASKSTVQEWHRAIDVLTSSAIEFSGVKDEVLPILKYSYDSLNGEQVKSCFLYLSMFHEDYVLSKERLIDFWISEGFIDERAGRDKAFNQGYETIGTLVRVCLLVEEGRSKTFVKMHDVVREMALWISSELEEKGDKSIVRAGVGLCEVPKMNKWKNVTRISLMGNEIEKIDESLDCPQLTTLLLGENRKLATISGKFFRSMPKLLVLDLSWNVSLSELPEEISELVSLRYLGLSVTNIRRLPVGLQELKMLIHLNLEHTIKLESLYGISNLLSLRTLKLGKSNVWLDMSLMKELQLLEHLECISTIISSGLVGELLHHPRVGTSIQHIYIKERPEDSVRVLLLPAMGNLCVMEIDNCQMWEVKIEKTPWNNKNLTSPYFSNLSSVYIHGCHGLKDLTWLLFAPNLIDLSVQYLSQLEDIISKEKAVSYLEKETCNIIPFQKLERIIFHYLPELKSIYWNALPFQRLTFLNIQFNCPKLRKLPLGSKSECKVEEFVIEYWENEWIEKVEWEDEATRLRFLPSRKMYV